MLIIEKMITHILDPSTDTLLLSETCVECEEACTKLLTHKMMQAFTSSQKKTGRIQGAHAIKQFIDQYKQQTITFEDFSRKLATEIFQAKRSYALYDASDFILCRAVYEDNSYLIGLDNSYTKALTHEIRQGNAGIVLQAAIASSALKKDSIFMISLADDQISTMEHQVEIEAQKHYFYNDKIFHCDAPAPYRDAVQTMNRVCDELIKEHDLQEVDLKGKMKQTIKQHVESNQALEAAEIADTLFQTQPLLKQRFTQALKDAGIDDRIAVAHVKSGKAERVQRIKTDKGIELIIPVDYMKTTEYVEFVTDEAGIISIRLKNINRIISK